MSGGFFRVLAVLGIIGLLVAIGIGSYNAGVTAGIASGGAAVASGATVVYGPGPYVGHWGWGAGFGFFGFFAWILAFILIFALLRAAIGWGRWGGRRDWGEHHGRYDRARDYFDEMHRRAHGDEGPEAKQGGSPGA
ncbi:MAG TPA: hypothetical protein VFK61_00565 [Candidatus Limnocylindria bacterium]|jgi:hypothetical protein|nr:hypothetical protein [Candidatus Limnocylindria bacterium]